MASQAGSQKHRQVHHLSRDAGDPQGWVESITGLTADQPATDLLNNGSKQRQTVAVSFMTVFAVARTASSLCCYLQATIFASLLLAGKWHCR